jgi:hypothetical protein
MRSQLASVVLIACGLAGSAAVAQTPEQAVGFLDRNGDQKCDLNEYLGWHATRLPQFDKDGDGGLNLGEFRESLQGRSKQNAKFLFEGANTSGGRTLERDEFLGYHAWVFRTYVDTDRDGFMSPQEWSAVMAAAG